MALDTSPERIQEEDRELWRVTVPEYNRIGEILIANSAFPDGFDDNGEPGYFTGSGCPRTLYMSEEDDDDER